MTSLQTLNKRAAELNKNNYDLGNNNVVEADKKSVQEELTKPAPAAADISLGAINDLSNLIGKKRASKLLNDIRDPNVTSEQLRHDIILMQGGLSKEEDQAMFSQLLSAIALATKSEKLLTAVFLSDIARQPKNSPSSTFLRTLKEQPLSDYTPDFQKKMSTLEEYYKNLQDQQPIESKTLKEIGEAIIAISIAIREYKKAKAEKEAKQEEQDKKTKEEENKKKQEEREKAQVQRAIYYVYPVDADIDAASILRKIKIAAANDPTVRPDNYYLNMTREEKERQQRANRRKKTSTKQMS